MYDKKNDPHRVKGGVARAAKAVAAGTAAQAAEAAATAAEAAAVHDAATEASDTVSEAGGQSASTSAEHTVASFGRRNMQRWGNASSHPMREGVGAARNEQGERRFKRWLCLCECYVSAANHDLHV